MVRRVVSPATDAVVVMLDELIALGLRHVVVCPGSRSQALALAAAEFERRGRIAVHVRIDERVAGFTALGIGRESGVPAAVVVTSGTAVGNLLPAVMEAHHAGIPLMLLTADRPPELRGVAANQATRQPGIFSPFVRLETDAPVPESPDETGESAGPRQLARRAWIAATDAIAGPVHVNLPLREPLAGDFPDLPHAGTTGSLAEFDGVGALYQGGGGVGDAPQEAAPTEPQSWPRARTVIVAGADAGAPAAELAAEFNLPLIAEIVSGARTGSHVVADYRAKLRDPQLGGAIERVIVLGHPTLTREVSGLLSRDDTEVFAVQSGAELVNLNGATSAVTIPEIRAALPAGDAAWAAGWLTPADDATSDALDRGALVRAVWHATEPEDRLVFGSSRLVRVADALLPPRNVHVHANRGLAGIDGTVATTIGVALASPAESVTRVLLGDLTLLHDVGALLLPQDEHVPAVQVIVGNDGGGTIFDTLEVATVANETDFARVQYTPHTTRFSSIAHAYGWHYVHADTKDELASALADRTARCTVIEVTLPRS